MLSLHVSCKASAVNTALRESARFKSNRDEIVDARYVPGGEVPVQTC